MLKFTCDVFSEVVSDCFKANNEWIQVSVEWQMGVHTDRGLTTTLVICEKCILSRCVPVPMGTGCVHWAFQSWTEVHHVVTLSCSYCSSHPPFLGRKEIKAICVWRCGSVVCVSERASSLTHIILNRIFPSRVLLPLSFRSLHQDSRLSTNSAAVLRARLFVLERHCSGAAESMSQHCCHSAHLQRICSIIKCLGAFMSSCFSWWSTFSLKSIPISELFQVLDGTQLWSQLTTFS